MTASSVPAHGRARARGHGHRRRISQASRSSLIESIAEESPSPHSEDFGNKKPFEVSSVSAFNNSIEPTIEVVEWDTQDDSMHKFHALKREALQAVQQSRTEWEDTDFSRFALSS